MTSIILYSSLSFFQSENSKTLALARFVGHFLHCSLNSQILPLTHTKISKCEGVYKRTIYKYIYKYFYNPIAMRCFYCSRTFGELQENSKRTSHGHFRLNRKGAK